MSAQDSPSVYLTWYSDLCFQADHILHNAYFNPIHFDNVYKLVNFLTVVIMWFVWWIISCGLGSLYGTTQLCFTLALWYLVTLWTCATLWNSSILFYMPWVCFSWWMGLSTIMQCHTSVSELVSIRTNWLRFVELGWQATWQKIIKIHLQTFFISFCILHLFIFIFL